MVERKLWVLSSVQQKTYAATFSELDIRTHKYFYGCECGLIMKINEDQFLCREDIVCEKCEKIARATFEWNREMLTIPPKTRRVKAAE